MNEIDKLKIKNVRYEKALREIAHSCARHNPAYKVADAALNPPPPSPVTLAMLTAALKKYNSGIQMRGCWHWIMFFQDQSGGIENSDGRVFSFNSLQEAYEFLIQ